MQEFNDEAYLTTKAAVGNDTKGTAERLGKHKSLVQQMTEGPEKDRYSRFLQLYHAVPPAGAELFFRDFERRHLERMTESHARLPEESEIMREIYSRESTLNIAVSEKKDEAILKEGIRLLNAVGELMALARARIGQNEDEIKTEGSRPLSVAR
jgi:hypothetical protein